MTNSKAVFPAVLFNCAICFAQTCFAQTDNSSTPGLLVVVGEARDLKTESLLYREYHYASSSGDAYDVLYRLPDGEVIAEKSLIFSHRANQPALEQHNRLCGEYIKVNHDGDREQLRIHYRPEHGKRTREKTIDKTSDLVVDAGFDRYVREQWDALVSGDTVKFKFLAPSRLRAYKFSAETVACERHGDLQCFAIEPDAWLFDLFVDPIVLTYAKESRQLLGFTGLGNIADDKCDYMDVDIRYRYTASEL